MSHRSCHASSNKPALQRCPKEFEEAPNPKADADPADRPQTTKATRFSTHLDIAGLDRWIPNGTENMPPQSSIPSWVVLFSHLTGGPSVLSDRLSLLM